MRRCIYAGLVLLVVLSPLLATPPSLDDLELWPDPLFVDLPISGSAQYVDSDGDPWAQGEYQFFLNGIPGDLGDLPAGLVLNADWTALADGFHVPADSSSLSYIDGVWNGAFHFAGGHQLRFDGGPLSNPADGGVDFWFRLHEDLSDSSYAHWNTFFWLETTTSDDIYIETQVGTIYGTSYSGGQYDGVWTGTLSLEAGDWHHFAYGWNAVDSTAVVWLDGLVVGRNRNWRGVTGLSAEVHIGNVPWGNQATLADMDAVRLWMRLPTDAEMAWAATCRAPPTQCSVLLDSTDIPEGTIVQVALRVADDTGAWSQWTSSDPDTLRPALVESLYPPVRLAAYDQACIPLEVRTSIPCDCRASEQYVLYAEMETTLQTPDGLTHTAFWLVDPTDEYHEIAVRCSSLAGDIDPDLVEAGTGYRQLRDYNPTYPRVALLWGDYDPSLGTSFFSRYDLIITWSLGNFTHEIQRTLRALNPDLKILTTGYLSYGGPPMDEWAAITDPSDPHFNWVLRDPSGTVILESYWGHPFYNLTDSSCVAWLVDYNATEWRKTKLRFDGIYFDRIHDFITHISEDIDADQDGYVDNPVVLDSLWSLGMEYYLQLLREELPNEVICGNDTPLHFGPYINGRLFEMGLAYIMDEGGSWMPFFEEYSAWEDVHREPYNIPIVCNQAPLELLWRYGLEPWNSIPPDSLEWVKTRYQRMRFGLGTTMLSDGVSVYDFGTTWWGNPWWYDEYNLDMGYPTSTPYRLTDPGATEALDDFEDGTPGNYNLNQWSPMWAEITNDPDEVISGQYSLKGGNDSMGQEWNEFAHSRTALLPLQGDSTYTVIFKYMVLQPSCPSGYFYFFARSVTGGVPSDVGHHSWRGTSGDLDSVSVTFTLESYDDYYLVFGLKYTGEYAVDDILVARGGGGMWRRDFENGAVVINPAGAPQTVDLGDTLFRFLGQQDPLHNDGLMVTTLTLQGHDAILLLRDSQSEIPPPVRLTLAVDEADVILTWSASPGATGYYVYRGNKAWFAPSIEARLTLYPLQQFSLRDPSTVGDPVENWYYLVKAVGPTGLESPASNRVGEFDYESGLPTRNMGCNRSGVQRFMVQSEEMQLHHGMPRRIRSNYGTSSLRNPEY